MDNKLMESDKHYLLGTFDLGNLIDYTGIKVLGGKHNFFKNIQSICDAQMLISLKFLLRIHLIRIVIDSDQNQNFPKLLKFYANQQMLDFETIQNIKPTCQIILQKSNKQYDLKHRVMNRIQNLCIFVQSNYGGHKTIFKQIKLIGKISPQYSKTYTRK